MIRAILTSTVITPGVFRATAINLAELPGNSLAGVQHYIGHPSTRSVVEALGAIPAPERFFAGLQPGEAYLAVRLRPECNSSRAAGGITLDTEASIHDLEGLLVERVE